MPLVLTNVRVLGVSLVGALAILALSCSIGYAQTGTGLEPGVHVNPGSPAAKEYALPLNQARQTGGKGSTGGGSPGAPFGSGITPPGSGGPKVPGSGSAGGNRSRSHTSGKRALGSEEKTVALPSVVLRSESSHASAGGGSSILVLLGGGVVILVVGGFLGLVLRRSHPSAPVQ